MASCLLWRLLFWTTVAGEEPWIHPVNSDFPWGLPETETVPPEALKLPLCQPQPRDPAHWNLQADRTLGWSGQ